MEYNRVEALKAKVIAEERFAKNDIVGAKRFALMAHSLFPTLDGISQLINTINVYLAAQENVCGEKDLYAILGLNSSANEETLKNQYINMAVELHPNQNKSIGAEGAFKLLQEAWSTLSDMPKRMAYDEKIESKKSEKKVFQATKDMFGSNNVNELSSFATIATSEYEDPMPNSSTPSTFWTSCDSCKMEYEYHRMYMDHNLVCASCHKQFFAKDTGGPINTHMPTISWPSQQQFPNHGSSSSGNTYLGQRNLLFPDNAVPNVQPRDNIGSFGFQDFQCLTFSKNASVSTSTSPKMPTKMSYDQNIKSRRSDKKVFQPNEDSSVFDNANGIYNFVGITTSEAKDPMPTCSTPSTFWTSCDYCEMQYECLRSYVEQYLFCANCHQQFFAKETVGSINGHMSAIPWDSQRQSPSYGSSSGRNTYLGQSNLLFQNNAVPVVQSGDDIGSFGNQDIQFLGFSRNSSVACETNSTLPTAQAAYMVHETYQKAKREPEEMPTAVEIEGVMHKKRNVLKRKFSVLGNIDVESSESLLTKKRFDLGDITPDENSWLFIEQVKAFEMKKANEVPDDFSKFRVDAKQNSLGKEPSQMGMETSYTEKTAIDNKLEVCSSTAEAKSDGEENLKNESKVNEGNEEGIN